MGLFVCFSILRSPSMDILGNDGLPAAIIDMHMTDDLLASVDQSIQSLNGGATLSLRLQRQPHI